MCNTVVIHVRVRPGSELAFGWPVSTRREGSRCCGKWRGSGQRRRQTLSLVFEGTKLSVQFLQLSVLLSLKRYHFFDVPVVKENRKMMVMLLKLKKGAG